MIEAAVLAKYIPFVAATASGGLRVDSASVATAIATAIITAIATMYTTVNTLGVKMDSVLQAVASQNIDLKELKKSITAIEIDRASRIAKSDADIAEIRMRIARQQR